MSREICIFPQRPPGCSFAYSEFRIDWQQNNISSDVRRQGLKTSVFCESSHKWICTFAIYSQVWRASHYSNTSSK